MADQEHVKAVRAFNRFYTSRMGLTRGGYLKTNYPLAEARVLYELGAHGEMETSELRAGLEIDAGQLSRLLKKLEAGGVLVRVPSAGDARRQQVALTSVGRTAFGVLDRRSAEEIGD